MKKIIYFFSFYFILSGCSSNDDGTPPGSDPDTNEQIVAVNDEVTTTQDTAIKLTDLLKNDTIGTSGKITSIDTTTEKNGSVVENQDGTYTYIPSNGFIGVDTFDYTICNDVENNNCDSATVNITVSDSGSPVAVDDDVSAAQNTAITYSNLLDNDTVIDNAFIASIDDAATLGNAVLNNDGTIAYMPQTGFSGVDTFTYTLCDDDTPDATCDTATVTITVLETVSFTIPSELVSYYEGVAFTSDSDATLTALKNHITSSHTTRLSYGQRHNYLYDADEDGGTTENVILIYSGESRYWEEYTSGSNTYSPQTFNTEHVFPRSKLDDTEAVSDLHHLKTCDASINSQRSNFSFTNGSGTYQLIDGNKWYPGDDWRGDVARMVMYVHTRYGDSFDKVGDLNLFLEWNAVDPVSSIEKQRNDIIETAQGNRNPFIDNPYLATLIWGGDIAENTWK